jgi:hypothetical protein
VKPLSDQVTARLNTLFASAHSRSGQSAARDALEGIAASGERRAVRHLLFLLADRNALFPDVAAAIDRLLTGVTPAELAWLDGHARACPRDDVRASTQSWNRLNARGAREMANAATAYPGAIGMLASHGSGYVREIAVLALADIRDGRELPFLILRVNDWVPQVAAAATILLDARLVADNRRLLLGALDFILRWTTLRRRDHGAFVEATRAALLADEGAEALARAETCTPQVRRFIYDAVWRGRRGAPHADNPALDAALRDRDVTSRSLATRWLDALPDGPAIDRLHRLTRDSAPAIRSLALQSLAARAPAVAAAHIPVALLDRAASVRALGRFLARSLSPPLVPRAFYLERLQDRQYAELAAAIEGVGETGAKDDLDAVLPFAAAADPRVRGAVLLATARLDASLAVSMATAALASHPRSKAAALRALRMHPHLVDVERLAGLRRAARGTDLERKLIRLLARAPKWDAPALLLDIIRDADAPARVLAATLLRHWCNRSTRTQVPPTTTQAAMLRERLHEPLDLPPAVLRELRFSLQTVDA